MALSGEAGVSRTSHGVRFRNFGASFLFVTISFLVYRVSPHTAGQRAFTDRLFGWTGQEALVFAYAVYAFLLLVFYLREKSPGVSKSIHALRALRSIFSAPRDVMRSGLPRDQKLGLLSIIVKGFFAPVMFLSLVELVGTMISNGVALYRVSPMLRDHFLLIFNAHGYWFLFQMILVVDVYFFTIGYLIEHPSLKNNIRSIDSSLMGWVVVLACYPPFNILTARLIGNTSSDFPQFESPVMHLGINLLLLVLMAVYSWASVALNLKASNLTHRGIVEHGPYRFVRHPAYMAKNMAWWLGAIPAMMAAYTMSLWEVVLVVSCLLGWTGLYLLRALTEETHLRQVDGEYDAYCKRVRHRFIPGLI
ncbi:MAG TPA: isoprenylcysteine carboxylmethyltransferase family protein [Kiritimatiellia bacterium]|nr:isoprenylcysteine carboxylmethyltransferase family protein [Kiritimatiellia bacterium]